MTRATSRGHWSAGFAPDATAVRRARLFVTGSAPVAGIDLGLLEMAVSELASNAVLHARTAFVVALRMLDDGVRVEVADRSSRPPRLAEVDPTSVTGRGLMIVASVSRCRGMDPFDGGKVVWFEMGWSGDGG